MEPRNADYNLLQPLRVLLEERNVSRAAERLHVSQSTLSASLARLRTHFDDELLARRGNRYELTPLAAILLERSYAATQSMQNVFDARIDLDPRAIAREFSIVISDFGTAVIGAPLARALSLVAPAARIRFVSVSREITVTAPDGLRNYDGMVLPHGFFTTNHLDLFEDRWVCLVSTANERVGAQLTMHDLATLPWASTHNGPGDFSPPFKQMEMLGIEPRIEVVTQNFLTLPALLADTDRLAIVQASLAGELAASGLVRTMECPFDVVPVREAFWWHSMHDRDPEHEWLRATLAGAAQGLVSDGRVDAPAAPDEAAL